VMSMKNTGGRHSLICQWGDGDRYALFWSGGDLHSRTLNKRILPSRSSMAALVNQILPFPEMFRLSQKGK
jgi:hypothetical protein